LVRALAADRKEPFVNICARDGNTESRILPPNPALNRTGRYTASFFWQSARPAG